MKCGKRGHFAKVCRASNTDDAANAVIALVKDKTDQTNAITLMITPITGSSGTRALVKVYADTGATLCVAGLNILQKLQVKASQLRASTRRIVTATGGRINCIGTFTAKMVIGDHSTVQEIFVCKNVQRMFLSIYGCIALGIVH